MHIAHLTSSTFFGGPERQMLGLADFLPPQYQTLFLSFSEGGRAQDFLQEVGRRGYEGIQLLYDTPHLRGAVKELTSLINSLNIEVLCCHGYKANLLGRIAARRCQIPVLAISRGWTCENLKVRLYETLDKVNLRWMDQVVCVSRGQEEKIRKVRIDDSKIVTIANAIDVSRFEDSDQPQSPLADFFPSSPKIIVGAVGRLSPEKGFDLFVEAAKRLVARHTDLGFIHFGSGPLEETLRQEAEQYERIVLAGLRDDLDHLLPSLDVLVLPSYTEGMPNVVLEAFAAKVPVVATAVGGTPEVVQDGVHGYLVPPGDVETLTTRIEDLLTHPEREEMGQRAYRHVRQCFSFVEQASQYHRLFQSLAQSS